MPPLTRDQPPSRQVLSAAEETNRRSGHENLGFLSESHGFLPVTTLLFEFPASHRAWDELAASLPDLRWLVAGCKLLEAEDKWLFHQLKLVLREGVRVFERHEKETVRAGSPELMDVIKRVPTVIELYFARVLAGMQLIEESPLET